MKALRLGIATLLVASSISSLWAQWRDTLAPGISAFDLAHPEVPGDDPAALVRTMDTVISAVGPDDSLGVLYSTPESTHLFLAFRLAYLLYPRPVVGQTYAGPGAADGFASLRERGSTLILVLDAPEFAPDGAQALASPGSGLALFRVRQPAR